VVLESVTRGVSQHYGRVRGTDLILLNKLPPCDYFISIRLGLGIIIIDQLFSETPPAPAGIMLLQDSILI
jgi:hypothetical protein